MSHYRDELSVVAENREPISFADAVKQGCDGKVLVFIYPTKETADVHFRKMRSILKKVLVRKVKVNHIFLWNDAELLFFTEREIEHNALRGLGKVVWCE